MTTSELIITVIASILTGTCIGGLIVLAVVRQLLHTKDARIKILNEQLEAWKEVHKIQTGRIENLHQIELLWKKVARPEFLQMYEESIKKLEQDSTTPVDKIVAEMTVQAQHKESMNYWAAEGDMQQEDKRTPGSHQP